MRFSLGEGGGDHDGWDRETGVSEGRRTVVDALEIKVREGQTATVCPCTDVGRGNACLGRSEPQAGRQAGGRPAGEETKEEIYGWKRRRK